MLLFSQRKLGKDIQFPKYLKIWKCVPNEFKFQVISALKKYFDIAIISEKAFMDCELEGKNIFHRDVLKERAHFYVILGEGKRTIRKGVLIKGVWYLVDFYFSNRLILPLKVSHWNLKTYLQKIETYSICIDNVKSILHSVLKVPILAHFF